MSDSAQKLPQDRRAELTTARKLAAWSLAYIAVTVGFLCLVMAGSQALLTELVDGALSTIAPTLFLVGDRVSGRAASERYPYGFARAVSAAYLGASVALFCVGALLFFDAGMKLVHLEHPSINGIEVAGLVIWRGWLSIPVLVWAAVPAYFLGRAKLKLGARLQDKVLMADAQTNAADWQSAGAALIGIIGVAAGFWWADSLAALFISLEILRSGFSEIRSAVGDLMDRRPEKLGEDGLDPLPEELTAFFKGQPWVKDAVVRVREEGRQFTGEVFVVPSEEDGLVERIARASREACALDWRLKEMLITPVRTIPRRLEAIRADQPEG